MLPIILSCTNDNDGNGRIWVQRHNQLTQQVHQDVWPMERTAIDYSSPNRLAVAGFAKFGTGSVRVYHSVDTGQTWQSFSFAANGRVRELQWVDNRIFITTEKGVWYTDDLGQNMVNIVLVADPNSQVMDSKWTNSLVGYVTGTLSGSSTPSGVVNYTTDAGANWTSMDMYMEWGPWDPYEMPRRIALYLPGSVANKFFLLTSHSVYIIDHNAGFSTFTIIDTWNFGGIIHNLYPAIAQSGKDPFLYFDINSYFDDIKVEVTGQMIAVLGGYNGFRAHFNGSTWHLTDIQLIDDTGNQENFFTHSIEGSVISGESVVYAGNSLASTELFPYRPGLNRSQDSGVTISPYFLYGSDDLLTHHSVAIVSNSTVGCTDKRACNSVVDITEDPNTDEIFYDLGDCNYATKLTSCSDQNNFIYTSTQSIVKLGCVQPHLTYSLGLELGTMNFGIIINSDHTGTFTFEISLYGASLPIMDSISQIVAYINVHTPYNAVQGPGTSEFTVYAPPTQPLISAFTIVTDTANATLTPIAQDVDLNFQPPVAGKVVKVEEYPGECWYVCGTGWCDFAEELTLVSVHGSCASCNANQICVPCEDIITINDIPVRKCEDTCYYVGDVVDIAVRVPMPDTTTLYNDIFGQKCTCGIYTATLQGNQEVTYPIGSTFIVVDTASNEIPFTVGNVTYSVQDDTTYIESIEDCPVDMLDGVYIMAYSNCFCGIDYTIKLNGIVISTGTNPCDENFIANLQMSVPLNGVGNYEVIITVRNCQAQYTCSFEFKVCPEYTIEKDCYDLKIINNKYPTPRNIKVEIFDSKDVLLHQETFLNVPFGEIKDKIKVDGVYRVVVTGVDINGLVVAEPKEYITIVLCQLIRCVLKLITQIWCSDDPCCDDCDKDHSVKRDQLNRIFAIAMLLVAKQYKNKVQFILDEETFEYETLEVQELIDKLQLLANRCGECGKTKTITKATQGCRNC